MGHPQRRKAKRRTPKRRTPKRRTPKRRTPKRRTPKRRTPKRRTPKQIPRRMAPRDDRGESDSELLRVSHFDLRLAGGLGAGGARGGVGDAFTADAGEGRELVKIAARGRHDVLDGVPADGERVGEKRTVAAPRDGFGAHDGAAFCLR